MKSTLKAWDRPGMTSEGEHPTGRCVCTFPGGVTLHQGKKSKLNGSFRVTVTALRAAGAMFLVSLFALSNPLCTFEGKVCREGRRKEGIADPGAHRITGYSPPVLVQRDVGR